ncbi:secoisolariciresinol dehydrogenase-like [Magnolia sinica]|uniref:secoisolariciresinol dehydrogenase-like n=1 Tax=Magnolia sinica TaxID=86752 RepID=UPI00265A5F75|nr:secoisolariciresinol dehydrogenase-like [Magnolia sinica]
MVSASHLAAVAKRLEGKVALITGGASGIGEQTARLFNRHGAKVVIADIQDELGHSISKELGPTDTSFIHCDVRDEAHVQNAVDSAIAKFGKLDIMFNNAGIIDMTKPSIFENEKADFERVLSINVTGAFLGTKHAARVMAPARRGSIIITASVASVSGGITTHAYTCSKHAVVGLTKNAAVELGRYGIRVNCVSPYVVGTPLAKNFFKIEDAASVYSNLKGVALKAEDIAEAALYLGSDESRYVSGHNLVVDGGFTITNPELSIFN